MICKNCGHEFPGGNFCPNCGTAVETEAPKEEVVQPVQPEPEAEIPQEAYGSADTVPPVQPQPEEPQEPAAPPVYTQPPVYSQLPVQPPIYSQPPVQPPVMPRTDVAAPTMTAKLKEIFSDTSFLIIAILMSASVLVGMCYANFNVFNILFTIAFWLLYATAKSNSNVFKTVGLKMTSGTVKGAFIVIWVAIGLVAFAAILAVVGMSALTYYLDYDAFGELGDLFYYVGANAIWIVGVVMLVIAAALAVINIFFVMKMHRFTKSLCVSAQRGIPAFVKVKATRQWLFVMGVINGAIVLVQFIGNLTSYYTSVTAVVAVGTLVTGGVMAACYIIGSLWIKKYFTDC